MDAQVVQKSLPGGIKYWFISSDKYVNPAIRNVEEATKKRSLKLPGNFRTPMNEKFVPELDRTPEVDSQYVKFYQEFIGTLR